MRFPDRTYHALPKSVISTMDIDVCCSRGFHGISAGDFSTVGAWGTANRAFFIPVMIEKPVTIYQMGWENGTVSGNIEAGFYTWEGARIITTGTTPQAGASAIQLVDTANVALDPGCYFLAMRMDNTTGQVMKESTFAPSQIARVECIQVQDLGAGGVLPAQATFANPSTNFIPLILAVIAEVAI